jgi:hypothetical protein
MSGVGPGLRHHYAGDSIDKNASACTAGSRPALVIASIVS